MREPRIAKPCGQSWSGMVGDDRVRHCGECRKNVYNLAALTEAEIEALIRRTEGRFCARVYRRSDGRMMTADCPRDAGTVRRRKLLAVTAVFGIVTSLNGCIMGSTGSTYSEGTRSDPLVHAPKTKEVGGQSNRLPEKP